MSNTNPKFVNESENKYLSQNLRNQNEKELIQIQEKSEKMYEYNL